VGDASGVGVSSPLHLLRHADTSSPVGMRPHSATVRPIVNSACGRERPASRGVDERKAINALDMASTWRRKRRENSKIPMKPPHFELAPMMMTVYRRVGARSKEPGARANSAADWLHELVTPPSLGGVDLKMFFLKFPRALSRARKSGRKARRVDCRGYHSWERDTGVWLASFKLPSAVQGGMGRAPHRWG